MASIALACAGAAAGEPGATPPAPKPCSAPEFRQFDFWIGDWDVESAAAPGRTSRNVVTLVNDGCTLREEYTTPGGYAGTSLSFYDAPRER